jgi:hypothetical protein
MQNVYHYLTIFQTNRIPLVSADDVDLQIVIKVVFGYWQLKLKCLIYNVNDVLMNDYVLSTSVATQCWSKAHSCYRIRKLTKGMSLDQRGRPGSGNGKLGTEVKL